MPGEPPADDDVAPSRPTGLAGDESAGKSTAHVDGIHGQCRGCGLRRAPLDRRHARSGDHSSGSDDLDRPDRAGGHEVYYAVKAFDAAGNLSSASTRKVDHSVPNPFETDRLRTAACEQGSTLNFTPSTDNVGVVGYNVHRSTDGYAGSPCLPRSPGRAGSTPRPRRGSAIPTQSVARDAAGYLSNRTALKSITAK